MRKLFSISLTSILFLFYFSGSVNAAGSNYPVQLQAQLKNSEMKLNVLSARVRELQDNYAELQGEINSFKHSYSAAQQTNSQLQSEISNLKQQIIDDRKYFIAELNKAVDRIADETSKTISNSGYSAKAPESSSNDFYEYKVQPGATLSVIARAYKCSVAEIKKANKLKSDTIRINQILYIPKK